MSKSFVSLAAVKLYAMSIELPESEAERFYDHFESNGWKVGRNPMKNYEAALRNWKRTWQERKDRIAPKQQSTMPAWKQIEVLETAVNCHRANPRSLIYDARYVTDALRLDLKEKRAKLATLKEQQLQSI